MDPGAEARENPNVARARPFPLFTLGLLSLLLTAAIPLALAAHAAAPLSPPAPLLSEAPPLKLAFVTGLGVSAVTLAGAAVVRQLDSWSFTGPLLVLPPALVGLVVPQVAQTETYTAPYWAPMLGAFLGAAAGTALGLGWINSGGHCGWQPSDYATAPPAGRAPTGVEHLAGLDFGTRGHAFDVAPGGCRVRVSLAAFSL